MLLGKIPEGSLRENNQSTICLVPLRDLYCSQSFLLSELLLAHPYFRLDVKQDPIFKPLLIKQENKFCTFYLFNYTVDALLTGSLVSRKLYLRPSSQNAFLSTPIQTLYYLLFTSNAYPSKLKIDGMGSAKYYEKRKIQSTLHLHSQPALVMNTFFVS